MSERAGGRRAGQTLENGAKAGLEIAATALAELSRCAHLRESGIAALQSDRIAAMYRMSMDGLVTWFCAEDILRSADDNHA